MSTPFRRAEKKGYGQNRKTLYPSLLKGREHTASIRHLSKMRATAVTNGVGGEC